MKQIAAKNRDKVIDVLTERLTFERAGVKLYDSILRNMRASSSPEIARMVPTMQAHRAQEKEHEQWLEEQIRALGGDTHGKTEMSELVAIEASGVEKVVTHDKDLVHQMHGLLTAELVDNAGWELLLELADDADDAEARREIRKRCHEEEEHLIFVRRTVTAFARRSVLGQTVLLPVSP
jgi:bacterioferritin (cytochrome b1)